MSLVVAKGSTSYHLCGGLPLAGIGAEVRGSCEIPAWNLRRDHVCCRDFGLVVPACNAFQGFIIAGAPRQVRRWYSAEIEVLVRKQRLVSPERAEGILSSRNAGA